jgi:oxaloacetate decarboxylase gamma subunit
LERIARFFAAQRQKVRPKSLYALAPSLPLAQPPVFLLFSHGKNDSTEGGSMTIPEMFVQSTALAALGMTMVFGFLVIMVISVTLTGKAIHALGLDKDVEAAGSQAPGAASGGEGAVAAVISAALTDYQKKN